MRILKIGRKVSRGRSQLVLTLVREQVEENLERWRYKLERRGIKVSHSKKEYMSVNEWGGGKMMRMQGVKVKKVQ